MIHRKRLDCKRFMQRTGFQLSFTDPYKFAMPTAEKAVVEEPQVGQKHRNRSHRCLTDCEQWQTQLTLL